MPSLEEAERHVRDGEDRKALQKLWSAEAQDRMDPVRLERGREAAETIAARGKGRRKKEALELRELFCARVTVLNRAAAATPPSATVSSQPLTASQVTNLRRISAALFLAAALTVFLPYFSVERLPDLSTGAPGHTYSYTGVALITGAYKNKHPDATYYANDGQPLPFMVLIFSAIGLATLIVPSDKALAWILLSLFILLLIGGCAATSMALDFFGGGFRKHVGPGFVLGAVLLLVAAIIRFVLWRSSKEANAGGSSVGPAAKE
jgi:hypothetical protein